MKKMFIVLAVFVSSLGCTAAQKQEAEEAKQVAIDCTRSEVQQAVNDLVPVVLAVINGSSVDWAKMLEGLATQMGEDALACTLDRLAASRIAEASPASTARMVKKAEADVSVAGKAKAQTFLSEKGYKFQ